jgi:multifunctional cyclase/dehydratase/O-methyltransferase
MTQTVEAVPAADPPDPAMLPDAVRLLMMMTSKWVSASLYAVAKLGVADALIAGARTVEDLATGLACQPEMLRRVMRVMACYGVFAEQADGRFGNSPSSECLRSDLPGSLRAMAIWSGEEATWQPYAHIVHTMRTGQPAFEKIHGQPVFEWLEGQNEINDVFDSAMTTFTELSVEEIVSDYDFSRFGVIADLGGGRGQLLTTVLAAHSEARGILFDRPQVIAKAIDSLDPAVRDRLDLAGGDFFVSVPPDADVYVMRTVLHDWDDNECTRILGSIRKEMIGRPQARLLILDAVISPGNSWDLGKLIDIEMMIITGGRERSADEWRKLLARSGFHIEAIIPTSLPLSLIEAALD